jgi:pyruvate dehydrogenase E2 component (dihydrolipoamide acetyltransferase)
MPQLGETVTEGTITKWFKKPGDKVEQDEALFEVSTDKVDSEVPSPYSGYLAEILVEVGQTVDVGTKLAVIASDLSQASSESRPEDTSEAETSIEPEGQKTQEIKSYDEGREIPETTGVIEKKSPSQAQSAGEPLILSPIVRRLINENNLDPASIIPTGEGKRITKDDVLNKIKELKNQPAPIRQAAEKPLAVPTMLQSEGSKDTVIAFDNIRKRTAEHMVYSKRTSPHALIVTEVDYEKIEQARKKHADDFLKKEGFKLTYLPFAAIAAIRALGEYPRLNASVVDDSLIIHESINLSIAVDLNLEHLIVPVIHRAENLNLIGLARAINSIAYKARNKQLSADDVVGGTFTITNPGPWGTNMTFPIINQPQVAILSTDGVKRKPVVIDSLSTESIGIKSMGNIGVAFDHRAVDGAYVSAFLARIAYIMASTDWTDEL